MVGNYVKGDGVTPDQSFTLIVSSVGIGGALAGIVIGHFLTRSSQHTQWLRDRRLEEYKIVLAAVNEMFEAYSDPLVSMNPRSMELRIKRKDAVSRCFRTIANCVMIADDLKKLDLFQMLLDSQNHFELVQDTAEFGADRRYLVNILIKMAHKSL
jgi:hypothetical protein